MSDPSLSFYFFRSHFAQLLYPSSLQHLQPQQYCSDSTTSWKPAIQAACLVTTFILCCIHQKTIASNVHKDQDFHIIFLSTSTMLPYDESASSHRNFPSLFSFSSSTLSTEMIIITVLPPVTNYLEQWYQNNSKFIQSGSRSSWLSSHCPLHSVTSFSSNGFSSDTSR